MREVNWLNDVVYGVAHLLGVDPNFDLLKDHARAWASSINTRVRYAWELWDWPELTVTEERALRQVWYTDVDYTSGQGENSEVYYIPNETYYLVIANAPVGTLPTNVTYFTPILFADLDRHIAYEQYGKQDIGQVYAIHGSSPRASVPALIWQTMPSGLGLDLGYLTGKTVWITYKPRPPKFTSLTYSDSVAYSRGDVVLDLDTGDCYVSLASGTNKPLASSSYWLRQQFPYILSEYVKYAAACDHADDIETRGMLLNQAEDFLAREVDKNIEQGEVHYYRRDRTQRLSLGLSGYQQVYWQTT